MRPDGAGRGGRVPKGLRRPECAEEGFLQAVGEALVTRSQRAVFAPKAVVSEFALACFSHLWPVF